MRILITGGAGFVGSSLALMFKQDRPEATVIAFDNLRRRGSELTLARLQRAGVTFVHGDVRQPADLDSVGPFDCLVECSAEPSVQAGYGQSPDYVLQTNLVGTIHCLEAARRHRARVLFLSTSRVYPIAALRALPLTEAATRLEMSAGAAGPGWSAQGISADFPLEGSRSIYGATKLCSEHLAEEYAALYDLPVVVNRCGVLAGPWQMGKVDQGFVSLWCARHLFGGPLAYIGFGGQGRQVRDVLHVADLYDLVCRQIDAMRPGRYSLHTVGGGPENALSLCELTALAQARGRAVEIGSRPETHPADIPWYVTDISAVSAATGWRPRRSIATLVDEVFEWLRHNEEMLRPVLLGG
ncbi:CDP-paratose 2-epimerase [mine drainage metagenome]|uniref:CDP-paratose 2-epimerase n=1 Tax=mine drainage metagenome TaxID=410659 RepID=A0A1J5RFW6_9ZZZZ